MCVCVCGGEGEESGSGLGNAGAASATRALAFTFRGRDFFSFFFHFQTVGASLQVWGGSGVRFRRGVVIRGLRVGIVRVGVVSFSYQVRGWNAFFELIN